MIFFISRVGIGVCVCVCGGEDGLTVLGECGLEGGLPCSGD
jgi:hypothetical protein